MPSTLGYWNIQGYGQPIRLFLTYVGEDWKEKRYEYAPAPDYLDYWMKDKYNIGLDFPNLPYYKDDKVYISQSHAILRYLNRKYGIGGKSEEELVRMDVADEQIKDFRQGVVDVCYNWKRENVDQLKKDYITTTMPLRLKQWEDFLGDRLWLTGDNICHVDFAFYHYLDMHKYMDKQYLKDYPKLQAYLKRFEALPKIKQYMESEEYLSWPIWSAFADLWSEGSAP